VEGIDQDLQSAASCRHRLAKVSAYILSDHVAMTDGSCSPKPASITPFNDPVLCRAELERFASYVMRAFATE
jgi:hypothetical protein